MNAAIQARINGGFTQAAGLLGQTSVWLKGRPIPAVVDSLPFATEARTEGGGLEENFTGTILFLKSAFASPHLYPKEGDKVALRQGGREIRTRQVDGLLDELDPFLTCHYWPTAK